MDENRIIDSDISHYEGDHVVFRHPFLTEEEIYSAYKIINKIFYSWHKIFSRWVKIIRMQSKKESLPQFFLKILVITFVYFKLSIFQRHHAQKRVFNIKKPGRKILNKISFEETETEKEEEEMII